jgi:tetratricopeptide (TPR) repeat protein
MVQTLTWFRRAAARRTVVALALVAGAAVSLAGQDRMTAAEARRQLARADDQYADANYRPAYEAYERASGVADPELSTLALQGRIRTALRLSEFTIAHRLASDLRADRRDHVDAVTLFAESLWGAGLFDEAEQAFTAALAQFPESPRARFGVARSLVSHGRLDEALAEAIAARDAAQDDVDVLALLGHIYERMHRVDDAVAAYEACLARLPRRLRDDSGNIQLKLRALRSLDGDMPLALDGDPATQHVVPFRLENRKIIVEGTVNGQQVELLVDTGSDRTSVSRRTADRARLRTVSEGYVTGVGLPGVLRLDIARVDVLQLGSLTLRNFDVSVRPENRRVSPFWAGEILSPMSLGLSVVVDYQRQELTLSRQLPDGPADVRMPMRVYRLPMVRGLLNTEHPAYFVVDTGGELMSISTDVFGQLAMTPARRIPLRVFGSQGLDPDAFLLPGVNLDISDIAYREHGVAVLNLHAPSVLLGFRLGGILGHSFLSPYRVTMDFARAELRLQRF